MNQSSGAEQGEAAAVREAVRAMADAQQARREAPLERLAGLLSQVHPSLAEEVRRTLLETVERVHDEYVQRLGEINAALERLLYSLNRGAAALAPLLEEKVTADSVSGDGAPPARPAGGRRPPPRRRGEVNA